MGLKILMVTGLALLISGCASTGRVPQGAGPGAEEVKTFAEVYRRSKEADARDTVPAVPLKASLEPSIGMVKPYIPVIRPPRVIKAWVPAHIFTGDRKAMVAGHWAYVMLEETRWFIEGEVN